jgi:small-conductance mechanosensitive channel
MDYPEWIQPLSNSLNLLAQRIGQQLPNLLGAAVLLLIGWGLAHLLRTWSRRLIGGVDWFVRSPTIDSSLRRIGMDRGASDVISRIIFWVVFLLFFTAATETLGLPVLATWLAGVSYYLPRVLVSVLIVFAGLLAGNLARDAIIGAAGAARLAYGSLLGKAVQSVILLIAIVTAVDQLGIESRFLTATITIVIAAIIGGAALAFGLGSRTAVSNIIAAHYLRQIYRVGHTVRVGAVHGKIVEITPTAVILENSDGRVLVPAKEFSENVSVLTTGQS